MVAEYIDRKDADLPWGLMRVLEGRLNSKEQMAMIQQEVVTRVKGGHKAGTLEERLPREQISWQKYIQTTTQGRRIRGSPEAEGWAAEGG